jgi:hypothetical protein
VAKRRRSSRSKPAIPRSASRAVEHAEAQAAVYLGPWFLAGLAPIVGQVVHALAPGGRGTVLLAAMVLTATASLAVAGYHDNRDRSQVAKAHTLVTVTVTGIWLVLATTLGVIRLDPPGLVPITFYTWLVAGGTLAVAWNMRQAVQVAEARAAEQAKDVPPDDWTEAGHPGVTGKLRRVNHYRSEGVLTLPRGDTLEQLQRDARQVESAHGWPPSSASFSQAPGWSNARKVRAVVMHADPLADDVVWPGLALRRGQTLFDPIPVGLRANGDTASVRVATPDGGKHFLVMGMTGGGKTVGEAPLLLTTAALGADIILIDTVKQTQSFGELADVLQMFETEEGRARALIKRLITHTLPDRTRHLAAEGLKSWTPRSSLRFLRIHIEEAWSVCDQDEVTQLGVALRSAGGQLTVSLQRATYDQMPVTLRGQLGTRRCYGLMDPEDASYALSDRLLDAVAANPADWGDTQPGMQYIQQGGITLAQQATPVRGFTDRGAGESFAAAARRVGAQLPPMCPVTAASLGVLWESRTPPGDLVRGHETAGPETGQALSRLDGDRQPTRNTDDECLEGELVMVMSEDGRAVTFGGADIPDETMYLDEPDPDPEHQPDPEDEIGDQPADRDPVRFGTVGQRAAREEFDAHMERVLGRLAEQRREVIAAADFTDVVLATGWSRSMVYKRLGEWVEQSRLARTEDGWVLVRIGTGA